MNRRSVLVSLGLSLGAVQSACTASSAAGLDLREGQHAMKLALPGQARPERLWLSLPRGYLASSRAWPLLVFLHGSGERGERLDDVKVHGPPQQADQGLDLPFVLASPQLPAEQDWQPQRLHQLLQALRGLLRVDADRVLATGLSLGGIGAWDWAAAYPQDLAGIAPVCGHGQPAQVCQARAVPVRAYHGEVDDVVPLALQQASVDALRACGGRADLIVYPGVGHDAWTPAYQDPALLPWLMAQRRAALPAA